MEQCWNIDPAKRPTAIQVADTLQLVVDDIYRAPVLLVFGPSHNSLGLTLFFLSAQTKPEAFERLGPEQTQQFTESITALVDGAKAACAEQPPNVIFIGQLAEVILATSGTTLSLPAKLGSAILGAIMTICQTLIGLGGYDSMVLKYLDKALKFATKCGNEEIKSDLSLMQGRLLKETPNVRFYY